jgi:basic membrane protein A and related proteins
MHRFVRHFAVPMVVFAVIATACSKNNTSSSGSPSPSCPANFKVGLALDVGGRGDKSFNDAAYEGLQRAISDGLVCANNTKYIAPDPNNLDTSRDNNLKALAAAGYNLVEGVGFSFSNGVAKIAAQYPNVDFAVVDGFATFLPGGKNAPNVLDLNFTPNESSYLVGIAAAMQAKKDNSTNVGFLGGELIPLIQVFQAGYEAGVKSVDSSMTVQVCYIGSSTTAFNNPTAGQALSLKMYGAGADVIYHASGASGSGLFQAAAAQSKWAIGVDSDQYLSASPDQQPWILTSALKRVDTATYDTIKAAGATPSAYKPGVQTFDLANDGVGYSASNTQALTSDMISAMDTAKQAIIAGTIKVPTKPPGGEKCGS